jgi:uncharacterized protein YecE (DUF72 family)
MIPGQLIGPTNAPIRIPMKNTGKVVSAIEPGKRNSPSQVRIGTAGWSIPPGTVAAFNPEGTHLERYSRVFNCCEINSSFYRLHKNETWERWANSVPTDFRFSVKAPRTITHESRLNCGPELLLPFLQQISFLRDKLGPMLIQLPPSLEFDRSIAKRFLSLLRKNYTGDVVWEPRHSSWFDESADDLLQEFQIARAAANPACVPAAALPGAFADIFYFRLHGSPHLYYSEYSGDFLNGLAAQLADLATRAPVWCVFDNTAAGFAVRNAIELTAKLRDGHWTKFLASCGN